MFAPSTLDNVVVMPKSGMPYAYCFLFVVSLVNTVERMLAGKKKHSRQQGAQKQVAATTCTVYGFDYAAVRQ